MKAELGKMCKCQLLLSEVFLNITGRNKKLWNNEGIAHWPQDSRI
jgi:hypothetical protein